MNTQNQDKDAFKAAAQSGHSTDNNLRRSYVEKSRRLTSMLMSLKAHVASHAKAALKPTNAAKLPLHYHQLKIMETRINPALWLLNGFKLKRIHQHTAERSETDE